MNWFTSNTDLINAVANIGIFLVWLIYAQLLYLNFARQRHPTILISQIQGYGLNSTCMISNMSREPIHIECIIVEIQRGDKTVHYNIADLEPDPENQSAADLRTLTNQGPLDSAGYASIGMFNDIIRRSVTADGRIDGIHSEDDYDRVLSEIKSVAIRVVADYGPETWLVGAAKRFQVTRKDTGEVFVFPEKFRTTQFIGFRARHFTIPKWLDKCVPEPFT